MLRRPIGLFDTKQYPAVCDAHTFKALKAAIAMSKYARVHTYDLMYISMCVCS